MKIKDLPKPYKSLALDNQKYENGRICEESEISSAFTWSGTPQGSDFWEHVYHRNFDRAERVLDNRLKKKQGTKHTSDKLFYELDFDFITQMAERMDSNKSNGKYEKWNWKKPIDVQDIAMAIFRHTLSIMEENYEDDGREMGHIEALATNAMILNYQLKNKE